MQLEEMLRIVRILSNSCWVRWYAHFNHPRTDLWQIAFCAIDTLGQPAEIDESGLQQYNYSKVRSGKLLFYIFDRLDNNGQPYQGAI